MDPRIRSVSVDKVVKLREQGLTVRAIADRLGVSHPTVHRRMIEAGLVTPSGRPARKRPSAEARAAQDAEILSRFNAGESQRAIAAATGLAHQTVRMRLWRLAQAGAVLRDRVISSKDPATREKIREANAARLAEMFASAAQPVTVARAIPGGVALTRFASVCDWRAGRVDGCASVIRTRPALKGLGLVRPISGGVQSPWLDVIPPPEDGARMTFTAPPVASGCGSPAGIVAGVM
jgi:DNA-binding Lrp family transcriptional regulator